MANFPSSIPSYAGFTSSHTLAADNHASQSNAEQGDITAIATKMGTGASTPTTSKVLRGNGTGTSTWDTVHAATDVSGILGTANGGNGTSSTTGTGSAVFATSPTLTTPVLTTPTLTSPSSTALTNTSGLTTDNLTYTGTFTGVNGTVSSAYLTNPYKFSVYRATNGASTTSVTTLVYDTKTFDTGSNYSVSTGKFTAPISGFYFFHAAAQISSASSFFSNLTLLKNGTTTVAQIGGVQIGSSQSNQTQQISQLIQLAVNDTMEVQIVNGLGTLTVNSGIAQTFFEGFLMSQL